MHFYTILFLSFLLVSHNCVMSMEGLGEPNIPLQLRDDVSNIWLPHLFRSQNKLPMDGISTSGQPINKCMRKARELDPFLVEEMIENCPKRLQRISKNLRNRNLKEGLPLRFIPIGKILIKHKKRICCAVSCRYSYKQDSEYYS